MVDNIVTTNKESYRKNPIRFFILRCMFDKKRGLNFLCTVLQHTALR